MHLLNILLPKKDRVVAMLLSFLLIFLCLLPISYHGLLGAFFSIDPDAVYVANALSNIKWQIISYFDHPGTPAISVISIALIPLRFYSKFIIYQDFIYWSYLNIDFVFLYLRIFQTVILGVGLYLFLVSFYKINKSLIDQFIGFTLFLSFLPIYYAGISISAEALSILLGSVFIFLFISYLSIKSNIRLILMLIISGLAFSNRATAIIYPIIGVLLILQTKKIMYLIYIFIGFMFGALPLKSLILEMLKRIILFAGSTEVHAAGDNRLFDFTVYLESFLTYWNRDTILILLVGIVFTYSIFKLRKKDDSKIIGLIGILSNLIILIFAKFSLAHYQISNYLIILFCFIFYIKNLKYGYKLGILILCIISSLGIYQKYYTEVYAASLNSANLERFIIKNPSDNNTSWEWARSKEYSLIWINNWGSGVYNDFMIKNKCWDRYYIQKVSLEQFIKNNNDYKFDVVEIDGVNDIVLLKPKNFKGFPNHFCQK